MYSKKFIIPISSREQAIKKITSIVNSKSEIFDNSLFPIYYFMSIIT